MREVSVEKLVEWLGRDGAIAGMEASNLTVSELNDMATRRGVSVPRKTRRREIIVDLVNKDVTRIDKTMDDLLKMQRDDLKSYLNDRKVSRTELLALLASFELRPGREADRNLVDFVAREISDLGMYQRVAKGDRLGLRTQSITAR